MNFSSCCHQNLEQPDYQDLYENHSHQKSNDKLGGYVISLFQGGEYRRGWRRPRQNRVLF
jgi:hypothetical protein